MVHIYGWDPGLVSGWCHISVHEGEVGIFNCGETNHLGVGNMLYDNPALMAAVNRKELEVVFVAERYVQNPKQSFQPWSFETNGLIRYFADHYQIPFYLQGPSEVKNLIKDPVLKQAGLWEPSKDGHQMDAVRHALYYLITKKGLLKECLRKNASDY